MAVALLPWQAVLGAEVEVPTLDGPVLLTVPAGTRTGRKLRLRARGLANRKGGRGDLYAITHIDVPAVSSPAELALYRSLAEAAHAPRQHSTAEHPHSAFAA
jgi:curved DNA-binding protein